MRDQSVSDAAGPTVVLTMTLRERATELEYLKWFRVEADFGPADGDVKLYMDQRFMEETGKNLPEGWNIGPDGETSLDQ